MAEKDKDDLVDNSDINKDEETAKYKTKSGDEIKPESEVKKEEEIKEKVKEEETKEEETKEEAKKNDSEELENLKKTNLRVVAEFQNYKKRVEKEKSDIYKFANEKLMIELLSVVDNFERAIESFEDLENNDGFVSGIEMIKKSLDEFMEKNKVEKIESVGKPFDPNFHHAVLSEENDEYETDTVIAELQKGYLLNNRVIRPSMVKVSK